jgi:thioredoxin-related protein
MVKTLCLLWMTLWAPPQWLGNMHEAMDKAQKEHRHILLNFSGSDWCGPCILLRKEVFDAPAFTAFADSTLVLVNADFPRMHKHQLPKEQQQENDRMADQYNPQGKFPMTLLLDDHGKVLQQWEGNPSLSPEAFSASIRSIIGAGK